MNDRSLREALRRAPVPDAEGAAERGLRLARAAVPPQAPRRGEFRTVRVGNSPHFGKRAVRVVLAIALIAALVSPAGAAVRHWVSDTVGDGSSPPLPALTSLPAEGRLLVDSPSGPWVVKGDGSKRLLGPYFGESTWSPHGLYVAAASGHQLTAIAPDGTVHWSLASQEPITDPAWSPDGYRIAYRSGGELRIVDGDGTGDAPLAPRAAPLSPAWEPGAARVLAYLTPGGAVRAIRARDGRALFETKPRARPTRLAWSADGSRLLLVSPTGVEAIGAGGARAWDAPAPPGWRIADAAPSADGEEAAVALESADGRRGALRLLGSDGGGGALLERPGRVSQVLYSPDGRWLLAAWQGADQWLFLEPTHPRKAIAVGGIAAQFDPGASSPAGFPRVAGWCCAAGGG